MPTALVRPFPNAIQPGSAGHVTPRLPPAPRTSCAAATILVKMNGGATGRPRRRRCTSAWLPPPRDKPLVASTRTPPMAPYALDRYRRREHVSTAANAATATSEISFLATDQPSKKEAPPRRRPYFAEQSSQT